MNLCSLYYNREQRFYARGMERKMSRYEFPIALALGTVVSFVICFI